MITGLTQTAPTLTILIFLLCLCSVFLLADPDLSPRRLDQRCRGARRPIIDREFEWATMMLANAKQVLRRSDGLNDLYFRSFFAPAIALDSAVAFAMHLRQNALAPLEAVLPPRTQNFTLTMTCRQTARCRTMAGGRPQHVSAYYDVVRRKVNLCDYFFTGLFPTDRMRCDETNSRLLYGYRTRDVFSLQYPNTRFLLPTFCLR